MTLIALSIMLVSSTTFAFDKSYMAINASRILDIQTVDGDIVTISDLRDGSFKIDNSFLKGNRLYLKQNTPVHDFQLEDGQIVNLSAMIMMMREGGDMGGGGS